MTQKELIEYFSMDGVVYRLDHIDEMVTLYNISNNWDIKKYLDLRPTKKNCWSIRGFDNYKDNIHFVWTGEKNYYKRYYPTDIF